MANNKRQLLSKRAIYPTKKDEAFEKTMPFSSILSLAKKMHSLAPNANVEKIAKRATTINFI